MANQRDPRPDSSVAELALLMPGGVRRRLEMERGEDGLWRYTDTQVLVPGAADVPLSATVDVLEVSHPGESPLAGLVSQEEVERNSELEWVPQVGRRLQPEDGGPAVYEVEWARWQEHASKPVGVRAPEVDDHGLRRLLALEERELRFARRRLELITEQRTRVVMIASALGMTRREISELLGLSAGRVQQVAEDASAALRLEIEELLRDAVKVFRALGAHTVPHDALVLPSGRGSELLDELVELGLLAEADGGVRMTEAGEQAEMHLRSKRPKRGRS
jgi:hypothetical protein